MEACATVYGFTTEDTPVAQELATLKDFMMRIEIVSPGAGRKAK